MIAEGRACGFNAGREFGLIEGFFWRWCVLLGNNVVDGLRHLIIFFITK
jgi:hypothetical protein